MRNRWDMSIHIAAQSALKSSWTHALHNLISSPQQGPLRGTEKEQMHGTNTQICPGLSLGHLFAAQGHSEPQMVPCVVMQDRDISAPEQQEAHRLYLTVSYLCSV